MVNFAQQIIDESPSGCDFVVIGRPDVFVRISQSDAKSNMGAALRSSELRLFSVQNPSADDRELFPVARLLQETLRAGRARMNGEVGKSSCQLHSPLAMVASERPSGT